MLARVVDTAQQLNPEMIHIIYGHAGEHIKNSLPDLAVNWVHQVDQLGTGHAVMQALPHISHPSAHPNFIGRCAAYSSRYP